MLKISGYIETSTEPLQWSNDFEDWLASRGECTEISSIKKVDDDGNAV